MQELYWRTVDVMKISPAPLEFLTDEIFRMGQAVAVTLPPAAAAWKAYWEAVNQVGAYANGIQSSQLPGATVGMPVIPEIPDWDQFIVGLRQWSSEAGDMAIALRGLAGESDTAFGAIVNDLATVMDAWDQASIAAQRYAEAQTVGQKATALLQGVGAVWQATGQKSKAASIAGGALTGATLGANPALLALSGGSSVFIGAAAGALTGWIRSMDNGRDAVKKFAEENFGTFDALHARLLQFGEEGEQLWIQLTQKVGKGSVDQAEAAIAAIQQLMANGTMEEQAARMGFVTKKQLREIADQAVSLWEYMRDSGEYAADAVRLAWERAQEALAAAGDPVAAKAQESKAQIEGLKGTLASLDQQYASLYATIANEAPEEHMGVVEAQARAQLEVIDAQRKEVQSQLDAATAAMQESFEGVTDAVDGLTRALQDLTRDPWRIDIEADAPAIGWDPDDLTIEESSGTERPEPTGDRRSGFRFDNRTTVLIDGRVAAEAVARNVMRP
jgi:hypothetical protein